MLNRIRFQLRIIKSSKIPFLIFLITMIGSLLFLSYFTFIRMPFYPFCHTIARFFYYICLVFSFVMYYFLQQSRIQSLDEVVETTHISHYKDCFITFLLLLGIWNIGLILISLVTVFMQHDYVYAFTFIMKALLYNVFLPEIVLMMLIYVLGQIQNQKISFILLAIFAILSSPMLEGGWMTKPDVPIDIIIDIATKPFSLFYQSGEVGPDSLYGLQMESHRMIIFIFWILLLGQLTILKRIKNKFIVIIPVILSLFCLVKIYQPHSLYRQKFDYKHVYSDLYQYGFFDNKLETLKKEETINYKIQSHQMDVDLGTILKVKDKIKIISQIPQSKYTLTLYRGYNVKSLTGNIKDYKQEEDYIYIETNNPVNEVEIDLSYEGYHPKYYSNSQAVNLPGFFPWYPMEGKKQVFVSYENGYGMNIYNRVDSDFEVQIDAKCPIVTNLEMKDNQYIGHSDSLTIVGGYIKEVEDDMIKNVLPLNYIDDKSETEFINTFKQNQIKAYSHLKEIWGYDVGIEKKKIILTSKDIGRNYSNNNVIIFDDYILGSYLEMELDQYILGYYMNRDYHIQPEVYKIRSLLQWSYNNNMKDFLTSLKDKIQWEIEISQLTINDYQSMDEMDNQLKEEYEKLDLYQHIDKMIQTEEDLKKVVQLVKEGHEDKEIFKSLESRDTQ